MTGQQGTVQAIDRAVAILSAFSPARPVASVSELARATGLTRSTTHRLLSTLVQHGLVVQLPRSTSYCLGPRLLGLADTARSQLYLELHAEETMTALRDFTGETVGLHIMDETPVRRTIAQVESTLPLRRTYTDLGAPIPPHQGAPGKLLLAFAPEELREGVLAQDLRSSTTHARIRSEDLRAEFALIQERGYAISMEERVVGVAGIAAPVRDHAGDVVAALSISVPAVRTDRDALEKLAPRMADAAMELSHQLGFRTGEPAA